MEARFSVLSRGGSFNCLVEGRRHMGEARTVLQVREARFCMVEDRFRIVEAHGVLTFLPSFCKVFRMFIHILY